MEKIGENIKGSKYIRDFCFECGASIRVLHVDGNFCSDCQDSHRGHEGKPRGGVGIDEDAFGYRSVAIRKMEG